MTSDSSGGRLAPSHFLEEGAGQTSETVSARSPTKSYDQANSWGSIRASMALRMKAGLAALNDSAPVRAASA